MAPLVPGGSNVLGVECPKCIAHTLYKQEKLGSTARSPSNESQGLGQINCLTKDMGKVISSPRHWPRRRSIGGSFDNYYKVQRSATTTGGPLPGFVPVGKETSMPREGWVGLAPRA